MAEWPVNGDTDWNTKNRAFIGVEHDLATGKHTAVTGTTVDFSTRIIATGFLNIGDQVEYTIAGGVISVSNSNARIDTQSDDVTDNLDTINGGIEGDVLIISPASSARTIVAKDESGNLLLSGDFSMDNASDTLTLVSNGPSWLELSRSNNDA